MAIKTAENGKTDSRRHKMQCDELEEECGGGDLRNYIAELKARIQLDDDEMAGFLQLEEECGGGDLRNYIAELKAKLEDAKATAYAEMVDAGMRERRLRRALWRARAKIAKAMKAVDNLNNYLSLHENSKWFGIYATRIDTWYYKWDNVERKCRAKAEEYK
jgi:hypothetical protein